MIGSRSNVKSNEPKMFETARTAFTPGFFNTRTNRNNSIAPAGTQMSKTFENYIRARERAENAAKEKIDKLNLMALNKIKHQKLAEKANKNNEAEKQAVMEKHQEKLKAAKFRKD